MTDLQMLHGPLPAVQAQVAQARDFRCGHGSSLDIRMKGGVGDCAQQV